MTQPQDPDPYATPTPGGSTPDAPPPGQPPPYAQPQYGQQQYGQQWGQPAYGQGGYGGVVFASWGRRVGGRLIDGLIFGLPATLIGYATTSGVRLLLDLVVLVVLGYLNGAQGQTPGKRIVGIRLQRDSDGALIGAGMGIAREFAHFVDTVALLLGWLWPLWDAKRQTFADKIVGSVAVRV